MIAAIYIADTATKDLISNLKPNIFRILWFKMLTVVMGFTFVVKTMQKKTSMNGNLTTICNIK